MGLLKDLRERRKERKEARKRHDEESAAESTADTEVADNEDTGPIAELEAAVNADESWTVPDKIHNTEDLTVWIHAKGIGQVVDLGGRTFRPKGGYDKTAHNLVWHEHPHPHWYLPFVPAKTHLRNGTVVANERIALVCEGTGIKLENVNVEGMGNPADDSRNALILSGSATDATLSNVNFTNAGCYIWQGANATIDGCEFKRALHGVYIWGKCKVTMTGCSIADTERACVNVRNGAWVSVKDSQASGARTGSALWVGAGCNVTAERCTLTCAESYGVEATASDTVVTLKGCSLEGNAKGDTDAFGGGKISAEGNGASAA